MAEDGDRATAGSGEDTHTAEEDVSPASAFDLVAHEIRVAVIEALGEADGGPLSFGEIRDRVGVDDPGQCHYHVDRLCDRFVKSGEDGYELSPAGWQLVGALRSGGLTSALPAQSVSADGSCPGCGGDLVAHLRQTGVTVVCVDCQTVQTDPDVPPAILDGWSLEELPAVVGRYVRRWEVDAAHGFCPNCEGRVDRGVATPGEEQAPDWLTGDRFEAVVVTDCRRCGRWWHAAPSIAALAEPAVVALYHQQGIDLRHRPWWTLDGLTVGDATVAENPRRVQVPIDLGNGWTVIFDEAFEFVERRRR